jgi:hypothetical protein
LVITEIVHDAQNHGEKERIRTLRDLDAAAGPIGKKGATYAAFFRGATNVWGVSPWIVADG